MGEDNAALVYEVCERLDGMPLAIELAAARVRTLSLRQIVDSLHDRFRLLTGGARTAVRRQQTLRASVDWSHALLTKPEQALFRRLAAFAGGFDLDGAQAVGASTDAESYQLMDQLSLLVDKSLVVGDGGETTPVPGCATGCWRRCASTRKKNSVSPVKPTTSEPVIATITPPRPAELESPRLLRR